jgi:hypothetical protein
MKIQPKLGLRKNRRICSLGRDALTYKNSLYKNKVCMSDNLGILISLLVKEYLFVKVDTV